MAQAKHVDSSAIQPHWTPRSSANQRELGHSNLGIASVYLEGIDNAEIIETVHARRAPMIAISASPRL